MKSVFLHGELEEDVYIEQLKRYVQKGEEGRILKLRKTLYGLKQAPRAWYSRIKAYFIKEGFKKCLSEHALFTVKEEGKLLIVSIYVDDLKFIGNDKVMFNEFKTSLKNEFDVTDLGIMKFFLGVEVVQNHEGIYIHQRKYAQEVLQKFGMKNSNATKNPMVLGFKLTKDEGCTKVDTTQYKQTIESLMYITVFRSYLMYVMSLLSRYIEKPTKLHMMEVKRILRYLKGTSAMRICYKKGTGNDKIVAYSDNDYTKVINTVSVAVSFFLLVRNVSVSEHFGVPFRGCTIHI